MIVSFPLSQSDHQMQRVRHSVEQHRNAPFRSADWLAGELIKICETAPDNDVAALSQTLPAPGEVERYAEAFFNAWHPRRWDSIGEPLRNRYREKVPQALKSLATVAAANDEGVAEALERQIRIAAWNAAKKSGATDDLGYAVVEAVVAEFAAIRLLSQGGGK